MQNYLRGTDEALATPSQKKYPIYFTSIVAAIVWFFTIASSYGQVDNCSGLASAEYTTVGSGCTNSLFVMQNFNNDGPAPCSGNSVMDGWYKINSGSNSYIGIMATDLMSQQICLAVYSGTCGSLTQVACTNPGQVFASLVFATTPNTDYIVRIMRAVTAGVAYGNICIQGSSCTTDLPVTEGLNSATPACWFSQVVARPSGNAPTLTYVTGSTRPDNYSPTEGSGFFQFNSHQLQSGSQIRLFRSPIDASAVNRLEVKFDWLTNPEAPTLAETVQVQYSLDGITWQNAGAEISRVGTAGWSAQKVSIPEAVGQSRVFIGFLFTAKFSSYRCHIDNIRIEDPSGCNSPTGLTVSSITTTGATASWSESEGVAGYDWEIRSTGLGGSGSTGLIASGSTTAETRQASFTGLLPNRTYYLYVRSDCGSDGKSSWAASSGFTTPVFCNPPTGLLVTDISASSGKATWTAPATSNPVGYSWEIRSSGAGGSGNTGLVASGSTTADTREAIFNGLTELTNYRLYVRTNCGDDGNGSWVGPASFTTTCAIRSLPWTENFDGISVSTNGSTIFPACWKNGAGNWATFQYPPLNGSVSAPRSGNNVLANVYDVETDEDIWTPGFELTAGTTYTFSFWYRDKNGTSSNWDGRIMANTSQTLNGATMVGTKFLTGPALIFDSYTQVARHFTPTTSGVYYFAVVLKALSLFNTNGLSFDDFSLSVASTCLQPDLTTPSNTNAISTQLNWGTPAANSTGYEWETRISGGPGSGSSGLGASGTSVAGAISANATGLTPKQTYGIYARSNCGADGYSVWSGPIRLNTPDVLAVGSIYTFSSLEDNSISGTALLGSTNNTIMVVSIPVTGSAINNSLTLTGIVFQTKNTNDNDVQPGSAKLWTGPRSGPTTQIAAVPIVDGKASFSGLSVNLPEGTNYVWLTYDVAANATDGNRLAAEVKAGDITIESTGGANTGGTQPATALEHPYHRIIKPRAYCAVAMNPSGFGAISRIRVTTPAPAVTLIDNTSEASFTVPWGFEDFYGVIAQVSQGSTYNFRGDFDINTSGYTLSVWADLNQDGDFSDSGEKLYEAGVSGSSRTGSFSIPLTASPGKTTIRFILSDLGARPNSTACGTFGWGQVEDYQLLITEPACVTPLAQPTALVLTPTESQVAGNFTPSASATGYLVVRTSSPTAPQNPQNATTYTAGTQALGGFIECAGSSTSFISTQGLEPGARYWYWVFAYNNSNCSNGPRYLTTLPLMAETPCSGHILANNQEEVTEFVFTDGNEQELHVPNTCRSLIKIKPCEELLTNNSFSVKVFVSPHAGFYNEKVYAPRRYELTPGSQPGSCTSTITLYYSQNDFDLFNAEAGEEVFVRLPMGPNDNEGKSNLRIYQFHGRSGQGSGLPESYPSDAQTSTINPADDKIVWNAGQQRWEISFSVTGFSTFVAGSNGLDLLPVKFVSFTGNVMGPHAWLQWQTATEENLGYFLVESSRDGEHFSTIGKVVAKGWGSHSYQHSTPLNNGVLYYRVKAVDKDGSFTYTQVIRLQMAISAKPRLYPVPAKDYVMLEAAGAGLLGSASTLTTLQGKIIRNLLINQLPLRIETGALPAGMYLLKLKDNTVLKLLKQ